MSKILLAAFITCWACLPAAAQTQQQAELAAQELTAQEQAVIDAIKAKNAAAPSETAQQAAPEKDPVVNALSAVPAPSNAPQSPSDIALPESTKQQAFEELQKQEAALAASKPAALPAPLPAEEPEEDEEADVEGLSKRELKKCLTVAFIDIDEAFDKHPRTTAVKEQIRLKITAKEQEVQSAKELMDVLEAENNILARQLAELKPFYERIVVQPMEMAPKIEESADSLLLGNVLNRLCFSGCEILSTSPLNSPGQLDDLAGRIATNKKIIAERGYFIDNYKYTTREEILKLEEQEVKAILQDIYNEIKSFAKKRNIGAIVRKDEILYGEQPVNVTQDFITRLKKSKKYRKK